MFTVGDVAATVRQLAERDVRLERLDWCDEDGIARDPDGDMPDMAWFKDPQATEFTRWGP